MSMRHRLIATVGVLLVAAAYWAIDRGRRPDAPSVGTGPSAERGDELRASPERSDVGPVTRLAAERVRDDRLAGLCDAGSAGICVDVVSGDGRSVSGIRVELLRTTGAIDEGRAPPDRVRVGVVESDEFGECRFGPLNPEASYFLACNDAAASFFAAQPTPFQRSSDGKIRIEGGFDYGSLADGCESGLIPVAAGQITRTRLIVGRGGVIHGEVYAELDHVKVLLFRQYRAVRSCIEQSLSTRFRFEGLPPVGKYEVFFHGVRESHHYFGAAHPRLADGGETFVPMHPWDPGDVIRLSLTTSDEMGTEALPDVRLDLVHLAAGRPLDLTLTGDEPVFVHGLSGAQVVAVNITSMSRDWVPPKVSDITGLRGLNLTGPTHELRLRRVR